jgi:anti-sigma regulatory factor (Ser/Thr protein kinase)
MAAKDMELAESRPKPVDQVVLGGTLSEMGRLTAWIDSLSAAYGFSATLKFSISLCLEEAVSNVIRHGYTNSEAQRVTVTCDASRPSHPIFTVDDNATPFNPLELPELPRLDEQDSIEIGGQGIRLLRGFATTLEYEPRPAGNRLRIGIADSG